MGAACKSISAQQMCKLRTSHVENQLSPFLEPLVDERVHHEQGEQGNYPRDGNSSQVDVVEDVIFVVPQRSYAEPGAASGTGLVWNER